MIKTRTLRALLYSTILAIAVPAVATAATFTVSNTNNSGAGSLRQAILDANAAAGADTIVFSSLFNTAQTITLTSGDLVFDDSANSSVTITGPGRELLTISGNNASKIFTLRETPVVTITGVTLTGGNGAGASPGNNFGGAIYNQGNLTLNNVTITGNTCTGDGGGVYTDSGDQITVTNSTISNNTATGVNRTGGGLFLAGGAILSMTNVIVSGNTGTFGGGIYFFQTVAANVINESTIASNTATSGSISGAGGGIYLDTSTLQMNDSTVNSNLAPTGGAGGIGGDAGTSLTMTRSTVSRNQSRFNGAGINVNDYTAVITNSTISDNVMNNTGTGIERNGGGIFISVLAAGRSVTISFSTVTNNTATLDGGGIAARTAPLVGNTIIANNTDDGTAPDFNGTLNSQGYNLIGSTTGATISGTTTGNITGQDPNLGPLVNNGGNVQTRLMQNNSPVIDSADPAATLATDARNSPRPDDGDGNGTSIRDIGAVERHPGKLQFNNPSMVSIELAPGGFAPITVSRVDGTDGEVTVQFATSEGTATAGGVDYLNNSGMLTFANGLSFATFNITLVNDFIFEPDETVNISISGPGGGAKLGTPTTATLTILNDDPPPGSITVSGRVTTPSGQNLRNAIVNLTDSNGVRRFTLTSPFGLYSFENVTPGLQYTVSVSSKRYRFTPQVLTVNASVTVDFTGLE